MTVVRSYLLNKQQLNRENLMSENQSGAAATSSRPELKRKQGRSSRLGGTSYVFPSIPHPHGLQMIFMDYDYNRFINNMTEGATLTTSNADDPNAVRKLGFVADANVAPEVESYVNVELPFPRALQDQNRINNQAYERSFLFERLTSSLAAAGDFSGIVGSLGGIAKDVLGAIRGAASGEGDTTEAVSKVLADNSLTQNLAGGAQYLARSFLPGDLQKQAAGVGGIVANPLQTLAFTGVDLKSYTFTWDLFPSSKADSDRIKKIVNLLKHKALPQVGAGEATVQGMNRAFLKYPSVVRLNLIGVDESHFVRFKPAMLTDVSVDYSGPASQVGIMKGGRPAAVTLTLSFTELTIHTSEDYPITANDPDSNESDTATPRGEGQGSEDPKINTGVTGF